MKDKREMIFETVLAVGTVWLVILCGFLSTYSPIVSNAAGTETALNYPTPTGAVDYIYLKYEINGVDTWVQATVTQTPQLDGYIITAPYGYKMIDAKGLGIYLYSSELEVDTIMARFILSCAGQQNSADQWVNFFGYPNFSSIKYLQEGASEWTTDKLSLGYINENFVGDIYNPCNLDFTIYQLCSGAVLEDNQTRGNIFVHVNFSAGYNTTINFYFIRGVVNADIATTVDMLKADATSYNSADFSSTEFLESSTTFINNLTALVQTYDPVSGLSIPASLAACYNPFIDSALANFVNGTDRVTFAIFIILFVGFVAAVLVKWFRRE